MTRIILFSTFLLTSIHCLAAPVWKLPSGDSISITKEKRIFAPDSNLVKRLKSTNAISIVVWFRPENLEQEGPARILTLSKSSVERNFTVGQEGDRYEVRLRTTKTGNNGTPGLQTPKGTAKLRDTQLVYTWRKGGDGVVYLDGKQVAKRGVGGDIANWNEGFTFALGDELTGGRLWKGTVKSAEVYDHVLSPDEVDENFRRNGKAAHLKPKKTPEQSKKEKNIELFETKVTTILTQHCLECHDSVTEEGELDLSKRLPSHTEDGIFIAGNAADSLLWESIEFDDMPHNRDPLSDEEKKILQEWIEGGANWTVDFIDPAIYSRTAEVAPPQARRLTVDEYIATVRDTFGVDIEESARETLPEDLRADGFSNTAYNLTVDLWHVRAYAKLAGEIVDKVEPTPFAKRFFNKSDLTDKTMIALIELMGEFVLRGSLSREEKALYRGVSTTIAAEGGYFEEAVRGILEAMLQSPRFLYRIEEPARAGGRPQLVDGFEMASRMSYAIWGSRPDKELITLARQGRLRDETMVEKQAERMLKDPRAVDRSLVFISEWLHLDRLSNLQPNEETFPKWDAKLADAMREETFAYAEEVMWKRKLPLSSLLDADFTFVTPELAEHYGMKTRPKSGEMELVDLSEENERGGLLTQGSVLTVGGDEASMVTRGLFVLNDLLRGVIKDPPPCVDTTPVDSSDGLTQRAIAMERVADKKCGGCHVKFEPLAYGLEKFDGLGSFYEKDHHGNALREDGEILFPGEAKPIPFQTVDELMAILAHSDRVKETMTWKLAQYVAGRPLNARDAEAVSDIHERATQAGGRYQDVLSAIVTSDLVRYISADLNPTEVRNN